MSSESATTAPKKTLTEKIKEEVKEIFGFFLYMLISFSILTTFRSLILLQYGFNEFKNNYIMAAISALALCKVAAIANKLPILSKFDDKPLIYSVLWKATLFTIIMYFASRAEEHLLHKSGEKTSDEVFPLAGVIAHELAIFCVFLVLFAFRGVRKALGSDQLNALFFGPHK